MAPQGWMNLDALPENMTFGGEEGAFKGLGLSRTERLMAFAGCFFGGFACSMLGAILLITGQSGAFAVLFGVGAIISLVGTGFLIGFKRQAKLMFKPVRIVATIIMLVALALTFVMAFLVGGGVAIIFVVIQWFAMLWYSLSYIPYARDAVKGLFNRFIS
ncbi:hypothetical protein CcaverHIS002_0305680 [Cutaneotrichosporon cavernicola]|uniref:Protein transport protein SFT2 n=1 Tax=Cutaneotrichosporon cavernicola TaxID=279322 RepID=A0AA48I6B7_9TREE|nr:uncharacterized protein CcaverHIS019_0305640 [Cutaneotrichosporon cavernicola]BEI82700.1 hypothetical protein CcaverHIS002_0305680 [Cutaneotrichosporon cavernicola]BEI90494.1 hypothetical protein CcaverHIS019_0305640 [Cutaneotrichosporon cavernicola]BEI98268.1 hypothetical protein CcaverHIS631_0305670 [Cutaneotrichosporon cavernicola]